MLYDSAKLDQLLEKAKDWAQLHGLCLRTKERKNSSDYAQIAPFALLPSFVPKQLYNQAIGLQQDMNLLYHQVAFDYQFICTALSHVIKTDDFTRRLLEIYQFVYSGNGVLASQPMVLTIQRPDYMFHHPPELPAVTSDTVTLQQVEVNQIACSMAGLSTTTYNLHRAMLREIGYKAETIAAHLPDNRAVHTVGSGLAEAWKTYGDPDGYCLFVIEDASQNIFDQRLVEYDFVQKTDFSGRVLRLTLAEVAKELCLDEQHGCRLCAKDGEKEISVVYFRTGYVPEHYRSEVEWQARLMLERSKAIKCPWIGAQLAGTKKVQQLLSRPDILRRFVTCAETFQKVHSTFVGLHGFDDYQIQHRLGLGGLGALKEEMDDVMARLYRNPDRFVLKPQLEGGGNNVYGKNIIDALNQSTQEQRDAYILMDRIYPMRHHNYLVKANEKCELSAVVSEFGTYGYLLGSKDYVLKSVGGGHLLRTKGISTDEGGVMSGASVLDSPYLVL